MILSQVFSPVAVNVNLESTEKDEVFEELVEGFVSVVPGVSRTCVLDALLERERKLSTGIGKRVAVPHGVCSGFSGVKGYIGISQQGIDFDSLDGVPVHVVFVLLSGNKDCEYHLQIIKRLALILQDSSFVDEILSKNNPADVYNTLVKYEEILTVSA